MDIPTLASAFASPTNPTRVRFGVIASVQTGTVTVTLDATAIAGVRYLDSYTPTATDTVVLLTDGRDLFVLGKLA